MKKEINSKSKRKWIMGGLAAFASVALLTTGFAVWIVGSSKTDDSKDVNVTVDTANNKSIVFTWNAGADSAIELKEASAVTDGKIVNVSSADDVATNPLQISYAASTITFGTSYDFKFKSIQFSIEEPKAEGTDYASVKAVGNKLTGDYARKTGDYTYIAAPKALSIASLNPVESGNTKTITLPAGTLDFSWGTFFDSESPATFYNTKYANEDDQTKLAKAADEITTELTDMYKQLNGKKIKLVATLSETEVA